VAIPADRNAVQKEAEKTIGRPKKRWREQLYLWRRNGPNGPTLDVYDDDDDDDDVDDMYMCVYI
jgi:hypothetical protein